ncbi:MAG: polyketide synthase dehydratase domain-containing protein [Pirellulales bacterium]|nr:polyketide synthase dehydratase domain-containing protein [Pirellulales bacterium]
MSVVMATVTSPSNRAAGDAPARPLWPTELVFVQAEQTAELAERLTTLARYCRDRHDLELAGVARAINSARNMQPVCAAFVASDLTDLSRRCEALAEHLRTSPRQRVHDPSGSYFEPEPLGISGGLALLFPGEGAQYPGMCADLSRAFPVIGEHLQRIDADVAGDAGPQAISRFFQPPGDLTAERRDELESYLRQVDYAMFSVLTADGVLFDLLTRLGLVPDALAGHSAGELAALAAAGSIDAAADMKTIIGAMRDLGAAEQRSEQAEALLLAAAAPSEKLQAIIAETLPEELAAGPRQAVFVAMDNCPHQAVIVGLTEPMLQVEEALKARKVVCERLPFSRPYHTRLFAPFMGPLTEMFDAVDFAPPKRRVYSCTTARPFPEEPEAIRAMALAHWSSPVEFRKLITQLYDEGIRVFVEAGPRGLLTAFVQDILRGRPLAAIPADLPRRHGVTQLNHLLAQLAVQRVPIDPGYLYAVRSVRALDDPLRAAQPVQEAAAKPRAPRSPKPGAGEVLARHLALMDRFLSDQQLVFQDYLRTRRGPRLPARAPAPVGPAAMPRVAPVALDAWPLAGKLVQHQPGTELLIHRALDLAEDCYADEHTVGGRDISRIRPSQRGLPVMPMTFILEMMSEAACQLVPGMVVSAVSEVQILRWLAFDERRVGTAEIRARRQPEQTQSGVVRIEVAVRDLGLAAESNTVAGATLDAGLVARGTVELAPRYAPAPRVAPPTFQGEQPCRVTLATLYRNLFHGPSFQGVQQLVRFGEEGLAARLEVLPRSQLFRSLPEPRFLIDPVTVDVGMHPAAAWHLEQADQSGRILLPFELKRIEFFGPSPAVGSKMDVYNYIVHASPRQFTHGGEIVHADGSLWCRLTGVKCWRFYLPLCEVNFNGPKDEYFICKSWPEGLPDAVRGNEADVACVRLDPRGDIAQSNMQEAAARVTLCESEMQTFRAARWSNAERTAWLFGAIALKDAARQYWRAHSGEKLFIADLECAADSYGRSSIRLSDGRRPPGFPTVTVATSPTAIVAVATRRAWCGVGLAELPASEDDAPQLDAGEVQVLSAVPGAPETARAWAKAAKLAVRSALGPVLIADLDLLRICAVDPASGVIELELSSRLADVYPEYQGRTLPVHIMQATEQIVAVAVAPAAQDSP